MPVPHVNLVINAPTLFSTTNHDAQAHKFWPQIFSIFKRESSYCFQRVLAIAILSVSSVCLSVRPSVCHTGGSDKNGAS